MLSFYDFIIIKRFNVIIISFYHDRIMSCMLFLSTLLGLCLIHFSVFKYMIYNNHLHIWVCPKNDLFDFYIQVVAGWKQRRLQVGNKRDQILGGNDPRSQIFKGKKV